MYVYIHTGTYNTQVQRVNPEELCFRYCTHASMADPVELCYI